MNYKLDKSEEALQEKYSLLITELGDRFVVTDPKFPKKKYIGGNLYCLMLQAVENRYKGNNPKKRIYLVPFEDMLPNLRSRPKAKIIDLQKLQDQPEAEIVPMKPQSKVKPKSKHGAFYTIKKLLVEQPNITYEEIVRRLQEAGITASESSIKSCRSDFRHTIKVIKDLGRWKD